MAEDELKISGLDHILLSLKKSPPVVRIGILGGKNSRRGSQQTNAEIGARHEFGSDGMPIRSFLRMPLNDHLMDALVQSKAFDKEALNEVIAERSLVPWMKKLATLAEGVVLEAFASNGYGKWPSWKTPGYTSRTGQILVDTQQLRNSIQSEVVE